MTLIKWKNRKVGFIEGKPPNTPLLHEFSCAWKLPYTLQKTNEKLGNSQSLTKPLMTNTMADEDEKVTFTTFCEMTSLHGWNFIPYRGYTWKSTLFWCITIVCAMSSGGFIISNFANGKQKIDVT